MKKLTQTTNQIKQNHHHHQTQQQTHIINYGRYKTELCRQYNENGECKYGDKCQFAHGFSDLKGVNRHPKYKTDFCKTFHSKGFCPYGPRCHFIHDLSENERAHVVDTFINSKLNKQISFEESDSKCVAATPSSVEFYSKIQDDLVFNAPSNTDANSNLTLSSSISSSSSSSSSSYSSSQSPSPTNRLYSSGSSITSSSANINKTPSPCFYFPETDTFIMKQMLDSLPHLTCDNTDMTMTKTDDLHFLNYVLATTALSRKKVSS
jgi:hypothetical protein